MMHTYKLDMAAALEGMALWKKISTAYDNMSPEGRSKTAKPTAEHGPKGVVALTTRVTVHLTKSVI